MGDRARSLSKWLSVIFAICVAIGLAGWFRDWSSFASWVNGQPLVVFAEAVPNRYVIRNVSWSSCQVLGYEASCDCAVVSDLPATLPAGRTLPLQVEMTCPRDSAIEVSIALLTNRPGCRPTIVGRCPPSNLPSPAGSLR